MTLIYYSINYWRSSEQRIETFLPYGHKNTDGDIEEIIRKYSTHSSVLKIQEVSKPKCQFKFNNVTVEKIRKYISVLNTNKSSIENDIPAGY